MNFRIADTFTDSLTRLTAQEQRGAKTTAFDLQIDPTGKGLSLHRLEHGKDSGFWSARVNADIRIIIHRSAGSILLAHVDHHDAACCWAKQPKTNPIPQPTTLDRFPTVADPAAGR